LICALTISTSSSCILLMISIRPTLVAPTHHVSVLPWYVLLALMELVANSSILHTCTNKLLESIIMPINFQRICYDVLYPIVMSYNFDFINYTELRLSTAWAWNLWEYFIIVPSD
jgi:hypothetical protein